MKLTELRHQRLETNTYLGSPSLTRLANGDLLASHDYFGSGAPRNRDGRENLTSVYRSIDNGQTWESVTHIVDSMGSTLFTLGEAVYLLGVSPMYGDITIRRSDDNGNSWSLPKDSRSGLLFPAGPGDQPPNYHCSPMPVAQIGGRVYRAFEDCLPDRWPGSFQSCVISADAGADFLHAANWTMSNKLGFDQSWVRPDWGTWDDNGWLEGNVVVDPDGQMWNVIRVSGITERRENWSLWDHAAMIRVDDEGRSLSFDPQTGFIDLPGGHSKFTIRWSPKAGSYLTLSNGNLDRQKPTHRAVLSLYRSDDLREWRHCKVLLADDSGNDYYTSSRTTGFQYVDWDFDGPDILYLSRTAYDGAHSYHDSNRITFHRLKDYQGALQEGDRD